MRPTTPFLTTLLLALALPTHTANIDTNNPSKLEGSCAPKNNWPTESEYRRGFTEFCTKYFSPGVDKLFDKGLMLQNPGIAKVWDLKSSGGGTVQWVYEVLCQQPNDNPMSAFCPIALEDCKLRFSNMIDENYKGGLRKNYCVVDGTGGDFFAGKGTDKSSTIGEGTVLVQGGYIDTAWFKETCDLCRRPIYKTYRKGDEKMSGS